MNSSFLEIMDDSFREVIRRVLDEEDVDLEDKMESFTEDTLSAVADEVYKDLEDDYEDILEEYRDFEKKFQSRVYEKWKEPLDRLELLIYLSQELGSGLLKKYQSKGELSYTNEALFLLHGRALQVSREILYLLKGGYADAAIARWRALYETAVKMFFIEKHGKETAKRFLDHRTIEDYKQAKTLRKYSEKLDHEKIPDEEFKKLESRVGKLKEKYGGKFSNTNGWAAHILDNIHFSSMEEEVDLDFNRPYYKFACNYVHSGAKGAMFKLGNLTPEKTLLTGPSDYGLADPGQLTSISLKQADSALFKINPTSGGIIMLKICQKTAEDVPEMFVNIQKKMEEETDSQ